MPKKLFKILIFVLLLGHIFFLSATLSHHITRTGETTTLPDLTGKIFEEAKAELAEQKILIAQSGIQLHHLHEQGNIISQDPPANSKIKLNTVVKVIVSAGKEKVVVPILVGRTLQAIPPTLQEAGLQKGKISHVHTSRYAAGKIIGQYPLPEEEVPINARISFLVSQGEREQKFLMPDLLGRRASPTIARLKELGFRVGDMRRSYYPGLDSGIIINQSPRQGNRILKRNTISLEVSK
jgi:beta-lactam-binding protein with PASTA domain